MNLLHFRFRRELGLLAASALEPDRSEPLLRHVAACPSCARELEGLRKVTALLERDAGVDRPLPISSEALRTRVRARLHSGSDLPVPLPAWRPGSLAAALGLVGAGLLVGLSTPRPHVPAAAIPAPVAVEASEAMRLNDQAFYDQAFYERLEKTHLRANAARYLSEAQDVLIQVTAASDCPDSPKDSVDLTHEAQTSRSLLKRRAALVSGSQETLVAARGVMEEVEGVLRQVAELPQCTRRTDVDAIARKVDQRHLLMKIDLVTQELAAP